jgi:hypothetical protein
LSLIKNWQSRTYIITNRATKQLIITIKEMLRISSRQIPSSKWENIEQIPKDEIGEVQKAGSEQDGCSRPQKGSKCW